MRDKSFHLTEELVPIIEEVIFQNTDAQTARVTHALINIAVNTAQGNLLFWIPLYGIGKTFRFNTTHVLLEVHWRMLVAIAPS